MDQVSISARLQANCLNCRLHKRLRRGLIKSRLPDFSQFCSNVVWQHALHKDALAPVFLMEALREEIYKSLGCRVDGQQWNWERATGRGDVQNCTFRSFYHARQHQSCHLTNRKNINIYQFLDGIVQVRDVQKYSGYSYDIPTLFTKTPISRPAKPVSILS